jgi:7,8-dihydropterin-6-yl-methyl-4-(beta-D-ribofuranosyl)aminobenzene 5'-phosphate synthase
MCFEHVDDLGALPPPAPPDRAAVPEAQPGASIGRRLVEADEVRVQIVMDNSLDLLLASAPRAQRFRLGENPFERELPVAAHGYSVLVSARRGQRRGTVLFDTGVNPRQILYNLDALEVDLAGLQAIVLSHGHADHASGLAGLLARLGPRRLPLVLHPDAYLERRLLLPDGQTVGLPPPRRSDLRRANVDVIEEVGPSLLVEDLILVSGEVARSTDFEKGFAVHQARRDQGWVPDPLIHDDQCAIVHVAGKGLVVVTGCGHAGIVNILRHARQLTGVSTIHAVIGGFHLTGALFEPIIAPTVTALREMDPAVVVPGHCSGWRATHRIAAELPDAFIQSSVGTTLILS